ncbi:MAG: putative ATP-grasp-modified RiPP [Pseudonocardiaceae bacterium]
MLLSIDSAPETTLDSPLSSASLRDSVRPAATAEGPGPRETRPLGLRFAKIVRMPTSSVVRYCSELQLTVDDDGNPLIEEETPEKQWATKHTTDGDEGPEETSWGWEE